MIPRDGCQRRFGYWAGQSVCPSIAILSQGRYKHCPLFQSGRKTDLMMAFPEGQRDGGNGELLSKSHGRAVTAFCRYPEHSKRKTYSTGALVRSGADTAMTTWGQVVSM